MPGFPQLQKVLKPMDDPQASRSPDHRQQVESYFDEFTPGFYLQGWSRDHLHFALFEPGECPGPGESLVDSRGMARGLVRMVDTVVAPAEIRADHHVVDAGSGVGGTVLRLASTTGCRVTGLDLSKRQLETARRKTAEAGLADQVRFEHADCSRSLPLPDNSIDTVVNIESACHYSDRRTFLREVHRILKPGGRLVAGDWLARDGLTAAENREHILPIERAFALYDLESQSSYTEKLREAGLDLLEFKGYAGKEADNFRILQWGCDVLASLRFFGVKTPATRTWAEQLEPLLKAWRSGYFEIKRYCAAKPG